MREDEAARPRIENALWASLGSSILALPQGAVTVQDLPRGSVLAEAGERIERVAFPMGCVVSTVTQMSDGSGVEVGMAGREGISCPSLALGAQRSEHRLVVQVPGPARVLAASAVAEIVRASDDAQRRLLGFAEYAFNSATQFAACNALHDVPSRYARWLLMASDRSASDDLRLTQEYSAQMLGVRRPTVTVIAQSFSDAGLIATRQGLVTIADRAGLERAACECYGTVNRMLRRVTGFSFGAVPSAAPNR